MSLDKKKIIEYINDEEQIIPIRKVLDKVEKVIESHITQVTDFLDPYQRKLCYSFLNKINDIFHFEEGGYEEAERKCIIIYPYYYNKEDIETMISGVRISGTFKFTNVTHRDYLGAIMSLGLKREKIGDIIVHDNYCDIILHKELEDYVIMNLEKINNVSVKNNSVNLEDIKASKLNEKELNIIVSSLRIDNIISSVLNLSRSMSNEIIKCNKVKINFKPIIRNDTQVSDGDIISIRGKGRIKINNIMGLTKKGKIKILVKTFR